jgi:hypothetical protein
MSKQSTKGLSQAEKDLRDLIRAMKTGKLQPIAKGTIQMGSTSKPKAKTMPPKTPAMAMSPFPQGQSQVASAICSRCGHTFKPDKPIIECPECGLIVAEEIDGELEWTAEMKEPIPKFVYNSQSPEEIFYKSIKWHYDKWMKIHKQNPSASFGKI